MSTAKFGRRVLEDGSLEWYSLGGTREGKAGLDLTNLAYNPKPVSTATWSSARMTMAMSGDWLRMTQNAEGTGYAYYNTGQVGEPGRFDVAPGDNVALRYRVRNPSTTLAIRVRVGWFGYTWSGSAWVGASSPTLPAAVLVEPGQEIVLEATVVWSGTSTHMQPAVYYYNADLTNLTVGESVEVKEIALYIGTADPLPLPLPYFTGDTADEAGVVDYAWQGATDNSPSTRTYVDRRTDYVGWRFGDGVDEGGGTGTEPPPPSDSSLASVYAYKPFTSGVSSSGSSYWNTTLRDGNTWYGTNAQGASTDPATVSFRAYNGNINYNPDWSLAIWYPTAEDPTVPLTNQDGSITYMQIPYPADWHIPGPAYPTQRDGWVAVVMPDGKSTIEIYKCWVVYQADGVTPARFWGSIPPKRMYLDSIGHELNTDGINTSLSTQGHRASKWSYMGGAVRKFEVMDLTLEHAVQVALRNEALKSPWIYPARGEDGDSSNYSGNCPIGTRLALMPDLDINTLPLASEEGYVLAAACQKYGAFVGDRSGATSLTAERPNPKHSDYQAYRDACGRMSTDWNTIQNYMVRVSGITSSLHGGPGSIIWPDPPQASLYLP